MGWRQSQIEQRARLDEEQLERAYAELSASITRGGDQVAIHVADLEQADSAIRACLRAVGVVPGDAPDESAELEERIEFLCRPSGTMHRSVHLDEGWHKNAFGALLGTLDGAETVALLPHGLTGYCYVEPGTGRKVKIDKTNISRIGSEAVFFYRPLPSRAISLRDLVQFILRVFDANDYLLVIAAALVTTLVGLFPAWANKIAFATVVPSGQASLIAPIGALLLGVSVTSALFNISRNLVMQRVSTKLDIYTEAAVFSRVLMLPMPFFRNYASGNLAMRVSQMSMLAQQITSVLLGAGLTTVLSVIYLVQLSVFASALTPAALAVALLQTVLTILVTVFTERYERATMDASAKLSGTVTALLNGIQKLKLAGAENRAFSRWAHEYADYARAAYNRPALLRALPAIVGAIGVLGLAVIYYLAASAKLTVSDYMAFNVAYGQMSASIASLAQVAVQFVTVRPMLEMLEPILEAEPEASSDKPSVTSLNGGIEVQGVSFRYEDNGPYILHDLSFTVKPGEYIALVGKSGCGKSTIMRLLLGFEKAERGSIFYGAHDINKVDLRSLRQHIGTVTQDGTLFMGTVESNITIAAPMATLDDAWEAAELAGIAEDIRRMPMGMQTFITEGAGGVSGGQKQRLMIARAVCAKRRILMFDEATSALDNITQKHVSDALESLKCTRIVVAHRLSTVRHCDRILVVDGGTIAEEGSYDELIARGGLFAELVERQRLDGE